jgi:molybdopterin/thiamine biosynthesis adenylyltransferase
VWFSGNAAPASLAEILIVGSRIEKVYPTSSNHDGALNIDGERFDRQLRAFGRDGQACLANLRVGVVGCGGIGSLVVQQLVYLGVQHFSLIDDDTVERTNLNRLVGANSWDISMAKVAVLGRLIQAVNPLATVNALRINVRTSEAMRALRDVDIIFGCTDSDSSRLILNELATACVIPYIDAATGIECTNGIVSEAGGRLVVILPEFPCLLCSREIDLKEAHDELASAQELEFRRSRGYASEKIEAPSVISLNGVMASLAVTEFLAMTTGIKDTVQCLYYYAHKNSLIMRHGTKDPNCLICGNRGVGDQANLERFASKELPADLPH